MTDAFGHSGLARAVGASIGSLRSELVGAYRAWIALAVYVVYAASQLEFTLGAVRRPGSSTGARFVVAHVPARLRALGRCCSRASTRACRSR